MIFEEEFMVRVFDFFILCLSLVLGLLPMEVSAKNGCNNPNIINQDALVAYALACNPQQQALTAQWQAHQYASEGAGRFKEPRLMLGVAPKTLGNQNFDEAYLVELSQSLSWPGVRPLEKQMSAADADAWKARLKQNEVNLAKNIRVAFAEWQFHSQLLNINQRHQGVWQEFISVVNAKYASGTSSKSAVLQATHEHHLLKQEAIELKAMLVRDISELKRLTNLTEENIFIDLENMNTQEMFFSQDKSVLSHKDLNYFKKNLYQQPMLQLLDAEQQKKDYELSLIKKDRFPTLDVKASYNGLWMNDEQRWLVGLGVGLPLDFAKRKHTENSVLAEQLALQWQQQDLQLQLREYLQQRYSQWQQAKDVYALYQSDLLPLAKENLSTSRDEYQSGSSDFLSLLRAQQQLLFTQRKAQQALHDQFSQFAELLAAAGMVFESEFGGELEQSLEKLLHE